MNRNDLTNMLAAVLLSAAVLAAWYYFIAPPQQRPAGPSAPPPAAQEPATERAPAEIPPPASLTTPPPAVAQERVAGEVGRVEVIETPTQRLLVAARGGRVLEWKLPKYERVPGKPKSGAVDLVSDESARMDRHPLVLVTGDAVLDATINQAPCTIEVAEPGADGTRRVSFRWADAGLALEKTLTLTGEYLARVEWSLTREGRPVQASLWLGPSLGRTTEAAATQYSYRGHAHVPKGNGSVATYTAEKLEGDMSFGAGLAPRWLALSDQYFALAVVIPPDAAGAAILKVPNGGLALTVAARDVTLFAGPKATGVLASVDRQLNTNLEALVPWGWFGFVARPLYAGLAWLYELVRNWGFAIVIATIIIRVAFIPLTHRSMVKMRAAQQQMAKVQPKIHKLREKYKDKRDIESRRKLNEEMMELYRREGINPMAQLSGCLPLLLQLPVLWAMFTVLNVAAELRGAPFIGWIHDLSARDPYYVLPILMGGTQLIQQLMTMTKTEDPQARSQQRIMLAMPVIFTWIFANMPSGLVLYWLVQNIVSIAQQVFINRHAAAPAAAR